MSSFSDTVESQKMLTATATSTVAANTVGLFVGGARNFSLDALWTPGATSNVLTLKIFFSHSESHVPDASAKWIQEMAWTYTGSIGTRTLKQLDHTAASTAEVGLSYSFQKETKRIRVEYSETVSAGALTLLLLAQHA